MKTWSYLFQTYVFMMFAPLILSEPHTAHIEGSDIKNEPLTTPLPSKFDFPFLSFPFIESVYNEMKSTIKGFTKRGVVVTGLWQILYEREIPWQKLQITTTHISPLFSCLKSLEQKARGNKEGFADVKASSPIGRLQSFFYVPKMFDLLAWFLCFFHFLKLYASHWWRA